MTLNSSSDSIENNLKFVVEVARRSGRLNLKPPCTWSDSSSESDHASLKVPYRPHDRASHKEVKNRPSREQSRAFVNQTHAKYESQGFDKPRLYLRKRRRPARNQQSAGSKSKRARSVADKEKVASRSQHIATPPRRARKRTTRPIQVKRQSAARSLTEEGEEFSSSSSSDTTQKPQQRQKSTSTTGKPSGDNIKDTGQRHPKRAPSSRKHAHFSRRSLSKMERERRRLQTSLQPAAAGGGYRVGQRRACGVQGVSYARIPYSFRGRIRRSNRLSVKDRLDYERLKRKGLSDEELEGQKGGSRQRGLGGKAGEHVKPKWEPRKPPQGLEKYDEVAQRYLTTLRHAIFVLRSLRERWRGTASVELEQRSVPLREEVERAERKLGEAKTGLRQVIGKLQRLYRGGELGSDWDEADVFCGVCHRGDVRRNNDIAVCDRCTLPYHQRCHQPMLTQEDLGDSEDDWWCARCDYLYDDVSNSILDAYGEDNEKRRTWERVGELLRRDHVDLPMLDETEIWACGEHEEGSEDDSRDEEHRDGSRSEGSQGSGGDSGEEEGNGKGSDASALPPRPPSRRLAERAKKGGSRRNSHTAARGRRKEDSGQPKRRAQAGLRGCQSSDSDDEEQEESDASALPRRAPSRRLAERAKRKQVRTDRHAAGRGRGQDEVHLQSRRSARTQSRQGNSAPLPRHVLCKKSLLIPQRVSRRGTEQDRRLGDFRKGKTEAHSSTRRKRREGLAVSGSIARKGRGKAFAGSVSAGADLLAGLLDDYHSSLDSEYTEGSGSNVADSFDSDFG